MDVQYLISQVMDMVKQSRGENLAQHRLDIETKKDMEDRKNRTELEKQWAVNLGDRNRQELLNQGALAVQGSKNVGDVDVQGLKKQRLHNVGTGYVADVGLTGDKYKADRLVEAYQGRASDPDKVLDEMIKSGVLSKPQEILEMRRKLRGQNQGLTPTPDTDRRYITPGSISSSTPPVLEPGRGSNWLTKAPGYVAPVEPTLASTPRIQPTIRNDFSIVDPIQAAARKRWSDTIEGGIDYSLDAGKSIGRGAYNIGGNVLRSGFGQIGRSYE
jgi:hypothetical protein